MDSLILYKFIKIYAVELSKVYIAFPVRLQLGAAQILTLTTNTLTCFE